MGSFDAPIASRGPPAPPSGEASEGVLEGRGSPGVQVENARTSDRRHTGATAPTDGPNGCLGSTAPGWLWATIRASILRRVSVDAAAEAADPHKTSRRWWVLPALLFVAVFALLVTSVVATVQRQELAAERDDRREIERVSSELAAALLTYDFEDLDASRDRVLSRSTRKFRKEYEEAFEAGLRALLTETRATSRGTVTDIYVSDIRDATASTIVVADAVADGTGGRRASHASYIQLDLVEVGGRWRVDGVTNLTFGRDSAGTTETADQ